jgi:hypothetical protein
MLGLIGSWPVGSRLSSMSLRALLIRLHLIVYANALANAGIPVGGGSVLGGLAVAIAVPQFVGMLQREN